ncbi:Peptidase A22B signal peptide peptidase [Penicillium herquei]|nr:Peptidase A22B signal peptide peptidase [Penicillium herquei]
MAEAEISPLAELLGHAFYHFDRMRPLLPTYGHLLVSALFPIWIGAHASLSRPSSAAKPPKKSDEDLDDDEDDEDNEDDQGPVQKMEGLEPSDALMFPLTAGLTLGGLYLVIKWLEDPAILNKILGFYFSQMGLFFAVAFLKDTLLIVRSVFFPRHYRYGGKLYHAKQSERVFKAEFTNELRHSPLPGIFSAIPLPGFLQSFLWTCRGISYRRLRLRAHIRGLFEIKPLVGLLDLLSGIIALIAVGYFTFVVKPWWLTNFLGFSFSYGTLQFMSPSTFWTGSLILGSLFFYDIYFVFFTPLMVTVATKLDVPIKLLFPRPPSPGDKPGIEALAMLGLGDIVIPGMMVGLALRFDLFLYYRNKGIKKAQAEGLKEGASKPLYQRATGSWGERFWAPATIPEETEIQPPYHDARSFPKVYFKASIVGYIVGMITTLLAMQYSNHAQPALLYLVPGVLTSLWGTAFFRGEIKSMWGFSDADEEDEEDEEDDQDTTEPKDAEDKKETGDAETKSFFMRIWSGEANLFGSSDNKEKADKGAQDKSKETKKGSKTEDKAEDLDLVSFSISLRRKSQITLKSTDDDKPVMIPGPVDEEDERPLKKRRGTPRKPTF